MKGGMRTVVATVVATGVAKLIFPDSIYTQSLRVRGIRAGSSDLRALGLE
jgi:H+/Cl- antiporter ClcA